MTLKLWMQAKIACANSIHDLDSIDGALAEWLSHDLVLSSQAIDMKLTCELAAKECHAMIDVFDACMLEGGSLDEIRLMEIVRNVVCHSRLDFC